MAETITLPDFVLKRLGLESAKSALLEEQIAERDRTIQELSDALKLQGEGMDVPAEGVPVDRLASAVEKVRNGSTA